MNDALKQSPGNLTQEIAAEGARAAEISRGVVALIRRFIGRGPTRVRTTVNTNFVLVMLDETLTKAEQNLVSVGQLDAVIAMRRTYQEAMRAETKALVEEITGRTVISAMSDIDPTANIAVEVFVLEHEPETGVTFTAEAEAEV